MPLRELLFAQTMVNVKIRQSDSKLVFEFRVLFFSFAFVQLTSGSLQNSVNFEPFDLHFCIWVDTVRIYLTVSQKSTQLVLPENGHNPSHNP